jgi:hypothetical protein
VLKRIYHDNFVRAASDEPRALDVAQAVAVCERLAATAEVLSGTSAAETEAARVASALAEE